ncbi:phosphate ABC transporter substrate-binding protein PstS [Streptomyces sp. NPDC017993]|uniref:phosphate ABC transporter substrate-binding protein PstS n=1 Tax=Streptomyces sp. NPDC017993 TaxID=3365027 RepID=UPI00379F1B44
MKHQRMSGPRTLSVATAVASGALILTACGASDSSSSADASPTPTAAAATSDADGIPCGKAATLQASGSTAQQYAMQNWIKNYTRACPDIKINYEGNGSGDGQDDFLAGKTAFAGSDSALSTEQVSQSKKTCSGKGQAVHLPMVGGPIALGFNLPGVTELTLDASTLAKIFNAQITTWNDPAIAKLNSGVKLPSTAIQAAHRSDSSGTTDGFTSYLRTAAPDAWPYEHSKEWKAKGGRSAESSAGLADKVKQTEGSIGYFELSYAAARKIPTVALSTGAPAPVQASILSASKSIADSKIVGKGKDLTLQLNYATKAPGAYPVDVVTYEIVCDKGNKPATWPATKAFLTYVAGKKGQENLSFQGYATLPANVVNKVRSTVNGLS